MERLARFVVRHRGLVLFVAVLLLIPSLLGAIGTYINYDILTYLPAELDSMIGETYLEDDSTWPARPCSRWKTYPPLRP